MARVRAYAHGNGSIVKQEETQNLMMSRSSTDFIEQIRVSIHILRRLHIHNDVTLSHRHWKWNQKTALIPKRGHLFVPKYLKVKARDLILLIIPISECLWCRKWQNHIHGRIWHHGFKPRVITWPFTEVKKTKTRASNLKGDVMPNSRIACRYPLPVPSPLQQIFAEVENLFPKHYLGDKSNEDWQYDLSYNKVGWRVDRPAILLHFDTRDMELSH